MKEFCWIRHFSDGTFETLQRVLLVQQGMAITMYLLPIFTFRFCIKSVSNHVFRTVIAYGESERMIGDSAVAQQRSNFKNTIPYINRFMSLTSECKEQVEEELKYISSKTDFAADKKFYLSVANKGEQLDLSPEQIYSAYLKKIKKMFAQEDEQADVVLSVPAYYSSIERQAVLDACKVSKVTCLRLMNENTAIALCYGFFKRKEFSENAKNIAFIDVGHGKTTCTLASFTDKKVTILSHASNRNLGGRNFDAYLLDIIGGDFNKKFGCDPRKAPKARLRMLDQIEKTRKILSANSEGSVNIECLLEDEDLNRNITRDELEELVKPKLDELKLVMEQALAESKLKTSKIDCIELCGEVTRMPAIQKLAEEVFHKEKHQRTINSSECVARGCSLMAAMILPQFHVANFEIKESNSFPIDVAWSVTDGKMKNQTLFPKGNNFPSVKSLTFDGRSEVMDVGVSYYNMDGIISGLPQLLARYKIEPPKPKEEKFSLKLRVQLDQNGIPALESAELIEDYKEIRKIPVKMDKKAAPKKDEKEGEGEKDASKDATKEAAKEPDMQYEEKEVKKTRSTQIHFKFEHHGYGAKQIDDFTKAEDEMCKQDNLILDIKVLRNQLETYVYDMRGSLDTIGNFKPFIKEEDRIKFLDLLNHTETWIYEDGESAAKDVFVEKISELHSLGEPVKMRYMFHDIYPVRMSAFENTLNEIFQNAANIPEDSHITKEEKEELMKSCQENSEWISNSKEVQASISDHDDPNIDLTEIENKKLHLIELSKKILNKPVPPKPEPKDEKKEEEAPANAEGEKEGEKKGESQEAEMQEG